MPRKTLLRWGATLAAASALAVSGAVATASPAPAAYICGAISSSHYTLAYGNRGEPVQYLQCVLNDIGYDLAIDGVFGPRTESAVKHWQARHPYLGRWDGVVDLDTWRSLEAGAPNY
ncbi:peptidoglycan-binding domain-containing protein [Georgenia deserti]|uniref:Peptidoglycan-binding protein n=1 Tax=Georgenia deserti TaxID=2093781 RepID=A0ABW4L8K0_9MICO